MTNKLKLSSNRRRRSSRERITQGKPRLAERQPHSYLGLFFIFFLDFFLSLGQLNFATSLSYPPNLPPNIPKITITKTGLVVNQRLTQRRKPNLRHRFDFLFAQEKPPHVITHSLVTLPFGPSFLYIPSLIITHSLTINSHKPHLLLLLRLIKKSQLSLRYSTVMGNFHSSYYFHLFFC